MTAPNQNVLMHSPSTPGAVHMIPGTGRSYTATPGTPQSVPFGDSVVLEANGWFRPGESGLAGTTALRPTAGLVANQTEYNDTTVGAMIFWDGAHWRHQTTGASV